jgi:hypothetical protein
MYLCAWLHVEKQTTQHFYTKARGVTETNILQANFASDIICNDLARRQSWAWNQIFERHQNPLAPLRVMAPKIERGLMD